MTLTTILFFLFGGIALGSALLAVTRRNAVASALWLVVMFFGLAGTYVVLEAFFVGAVQVLVYAGAIMVLFLFVIMLLDLREETLEGKTAPILRFFGGLTAVLFVVVSVFAVADARAEGLFERTRAREVAQVVRADYKELGLDGKPVKGDWYRWKPKAGASPWMPHDLELELEPRQVEVVTIEERLVDLELDGGAKAIAEQLFTRWLLAFEVTSILLLGAILGAVILTKRRLT